jgi:hypothetical protein
MPPDVAELAGLALAYGILHLSVDLAQAKLSGERPTAISDAADQLAHLALSAALVWGLGFRHPEWSQLGSGPILILGQPVELPRFAQSIVFGGLVLWIVGEVLRTDLSPRLQGILVAERTILMGLILIGPIWLAAPALAGRILWMRQRGEPRSQAIPSLCLLLLAASFRILSPAG